MILCNNSDQTCYLIHLHQTAPRELSESSSFRLRFQHHPRVTADVNADVNAYIILYQCFACMAKDQYNQIYMYIYM